MGKKDNTNEKPSVFAPVVSVLGHVDHGKTTLLDTIRKSNIASGEKGGITQKIGASEIEIDHEGVKRKITFVDTPGHEAFSNMRSQGVNAADIILLVVASDDGIKPQTLESIQLIKESKLPHIVVITKADLETAQIEKVKQQLLKEEILLEGLGGKVPFITVSAKTGLRIKDLLDLILLSYDLSDVKKDETADFCGVVIDAKLDKKKGPLATIVVKQGILNLREKIFTLEKEVGSVRAMTTGFGNISIAYPGQAIEILGMTEVIASGQLVYSKKVDSHPVVKNDVIVKKDPAELLRLLIEKKETLKLILKTETSSEMEALKASLPENIEVVNEGQGEISVNDVLMAKDFKAIVVGFNVGITKEAKQIADTENIFLKTYAIIYELLDELSEVEELLSQGPQIKILGKLKVLNIFEGTRAKIVGGKVLEGRIALNDKVDVVRNDEVIGKGKIISLRRGKTDIKEAAKETECGIVVEPSIDIAANDMILSHK